MTIIPDETFSAYLDGEADAATAALIEEAAVADPALAARLETLAGHDRTLRAAVDAALGPTPPHLLAMVDGTAAPSNVITFSRRKPTAVLPFRWAVAFAATLVVGVLVGVRIQASQAKPLLIETRVGPIAGPGLAMALTSARSGDRAPADGATIRIALSFQAVDGRLCRQFDATFPKAGATGIACRQAQGWRIEGWSGAEGAGAASGGYTAAAGPDDPVVAAEINRLGLAKVLDRRGETTAIADRWKPAAPASGDSP